MDPIEVSAEVAKYRNELSLLRFERNNLVTLRTSYIDKLDALAQTHDELLELGGDASQIEDVEIEIADLAELHKKNLEADQDLQDKEEQTLQAYREFADIEGIDVPSLEQLLSDLQKVEVILPQVDAKALAIITDLEIIHAESRDRIETVIWEDNQFVASPELKEAVAKGLSSEEARENDASLMAALKAEEDAKIKPFWLVAAGLFFVYIIS